MTTTDKLKPLLPLLCYLLSFPPRPKHQTVNEFGAYTFELYLLLQSMIYFSDLFTVKHLDLFSFFRLLHSIPLDIYIHKHIPLLTDM